MDAAKVIVHFDCDAFYAQCEEVRDPSLRHKPLGRLPFKVCGAVCASVTALSVQIRNWPIKMTRVPLNSICLCRCDPEVSDCHFELPSTSEGGGKADGYSGGTAGVSGANSNQRRGPHTVQVTSHHTLPSLPRPISLTTTCCTLCPRPGASRCTEGGGSCCI